MHDCMEYVSCSSLSEVKPKDPPLPCSSRDSKGQQSWYPSGWQVGRGMDSLCPVDTSPCINVVGEMGTILHVAKESFTFFKAKDNILWCGWILSHNQKWLVLAKGIWKTLFGNVCYSDCLFVFVLLDFKPAGCRIDHSDTFAYEVFCPFL